MKFCPCILRFPLIIKGLTKNYRRRFGSMATRLQEKEYGNHQGKEFHTNLVGYNSPHRISVRTVITSPIVDGI